MNNIYNEDINIERNPLSEIICIDEFKGPAIEGKLVFIIVNSIDNEVIDLYRLLNFNTKHGPQEYLRIQGHIYEDNYKYTNHEILERILNNDNDLLEAYEYLQELYYIVYNVQYKEARKELTRWCEKIKKSANKNIYPLKKVIDTIYEWENQIVNSFIISDELGGNITNGIVEAKNNVAKTIIKSSYGKNDFKKFRKQFLESERTRKIRN